MKKMLIPLVICLGLLTLAACGSQGEDASGNSITGVEWQWQSVTNQSAGETTNVPNPENYTITFNEDGTFAGQADCNSIAGTWSQENGFSITVGPSTLAFCGEASLDQQYVTLLDSVAAGGPDGAGGLALETAGGEQRMLFES
jgi:heat shock protein HslJ